MSVRSCREPFAAASAAQDFGIQVGRHDDTGTLTPAYEGFGLAVVNEILRHMNWIDTGDSNPGDES